MEEAAEPENPVRPPKGLFECRQVQSQGERELVAGQKRESAGPRCASEN